MEQCQFCHQPGVCRRSNRRANSLSIVMTENFEHFMYIPCYFKEQLNKYADKWMHALAGGHRMEFYLEKTETKTRMLGPFWYYLQLAYFLTLNDVVTFSLPSEEDNEVEITPEDENDAEVIHHLMELEEKWDDDVFQVTVTDQVGNIKPFELNPGAIYVPISTRDILYRTVFTEMQSIHEFEMSEILWEMEKQVMKLGCDEDAVGELQYFVHRVTRIDAALGRLVMPSSILDGYNYPSTGTALFSSRALPMVSHGHYRIVRCKNSVSFWMTKQRIDDFCHGTNIEAGSLIVVLIDKAPGFIGLNIHKIEDP